MTTDARHYAQARAADLDPYAWIVFQRWAIKDAFTDNAMDGGLAFGAWMELDAIERSMNK
jgi:hypothetical protein